MVSSGPCYHLADQAAIDIENARLFAVRELPPVQVKGKKQPLQLYEVLREELASTPTEVLRRIDG
jgi:class 3 adenylate cyclase